MPQKALKNGIPRIIHQVWLESPVSPFWNHYLDSWKATYPGWTINLWDEVRVRELKGLLWNYDLIEDPNVLSVVKSNFLRLELLRIFGGLYADIDLFSSKPIAHLLPPDTFTYADSEDGVPNTFFLASPPGHSFSKWALELFRGWYDAYPFKISKEKQSCLCGMLAINHALNAWNGMFWSKEAPILSEDEIIVGNVWGRGTANLIKNVYQCVFRDRRLDTKTESLRIIQDAGRFPESFGIHFGELSWK